MGPLDLQNEVTVTVSLPLPLAFGVAVAAARALVLRWPSEAWLEPPPENP